VIIVILYWAIIAVVLGAAAVMFRRLETSIERNDSDHPHPHSDAGPDQRRGRDPG
jgi:hypothetical protein